MTQAFAAQRRGPRWLCWFGLAVALSLPLAQAAPQRIITVDWTVAETLLLLGVTPLGVAQKAAYDDWVAAPALPAEVVDVGLRMQPNRELLAALQPDLIILSSFYNSIRPTLQQIAPVASVALYQPGEDLWQRLFTATREVAALVGRQRQGERLLQRLQQQLTAIDQCLASRRPLLVVQFIDARHLRVYGANSLFHAVLQQLHLPNAWQRPTNDWGFSTATLEELAAYPEARLLVVEPLPLGVAEQLQHSGLWPLIPAVREQRVATVPAVWSYGGLAAASRFARELAQVLPMQVSAECRRERYVLAQ